jgi:2-polyprenyl-6-methoxyphenol hydroxylase-like FAD-dependent oxidoreductase
VKSNERLYLNRKGEIIDREDSVQRMTSWETAYFLGRWNADGMKSKYVVGENGEDQTTQQEVEYGKTRVEYRYGCLVEDVKDIGSGVEVKYKNLKDGKKGNEEESLQADFLIVADGASSRCRKLLLGSEAKERKYAGYVAFRGTVGENEISQDAKDVFVERFTFFHGHSPNTQILTYTIPGPDGALEKGSRLVNWVWYWNMDGDSAEYKNLMTDTEGNTHRLTLPTGGKMQTEIWEKQKQLARTYLPPQFVEVIEKTEKPFVQAITDLEPPAKSTKITHLLGGNAVIIGDALAGFRPHTAASTSQAAYHALMLDKVFRSQLTWEESEEEV